MAAKLGGNGRPRASVKARKEKYAEHSQKLLNHENTCLSLLKQLTSPHMVLSQDTPARKRRSARWGMKCLKVQESNSTPFNVHISILPPHHCARGELCKGLARRSLPGEPSYICCRTPMAWTFKTQSSLCSLSSWINWILPPGPVGQILSNSWPLSVLFTGLRQQRKQMTAKHLRTSCTRQLTKRVLNGFSITFGSGQDFLLAKKSFCPWEQPAMKACTLKSMGGSGRGRVFTKAPWNWSSIFWLCPNFYRTMQLFIHQQQGRWWAARCWLGGQHLVVEGRVDCMGKSKLWEGAKGEATRLKRFLAKKTCCYM